MKHLFYLFIFLLGFSFEASAQPPLYDDLLIYFADGQYEKLADKAKKYTTNDKTKKDPLPYLYYAKGNFEMSKDQKYDEDFPKAFNDAISFAGKAIKKDKDSTIFDDHKEFYTKLKIAVVEDIKNLVDAEDYSRLRGTVLKLKRLDPGDVGADFLLAAAQYQIKDKGSAKISLKAAYVKLDKVSSVEDWREIDLEMMRIGILEYVNYLVKLRQTDKAKEVLGRVKQWYEEDETFMSKYDEIVN